MRWSRVRRRVFLRAAGRSMALALALSLGPSVPASADEARITAHLAKFVGNEPVKKVVNGTPTTGYPAVGALLRRKGEVMRFGCSGTLIGCGTFLTAAHCVCGDKSAAACRASPPKESNFAVFLQHFGQFKVTRISWPENRYVRPNLVTGSTADVAVLSLSPTVDAARPRLINTTTRLPEEGDRDGTIVGFGLTGDKSDDAGLKRVGPLITARCRPGFPAKELVCWNYRAAPGNPDPQAANSCRGDSGGPLLQNLGTGKEVVSGVTSGGVVVSCGPGDHAYDADVYANREWIAANASDPNQDNMCGAGRPNLPDGKDDRSESHSGESGSLSRDKPESRFNLSIAAAKRLLVTLNAVERHSGGNDFDLYVVPGKSQDDISRAVCAARGPENFAVCDIDPGGQTDWSILVKSKFGDGEFQVTATVD